LPSSTRSISPVEKPVSSTSKSSSISSLKCSRSSSKSQTACSGRRLSADDGSLLGLGETCDRQRRDLAAPEPLSRLQPRMAGKDGAGLVDQDRVGPNPLDASHQPRDLVLGMASRVSREGLQITDRDPSNLVFEPSRCARALGTT